MKNKIIVSLLLVLLIAISASAVSASEDLTDVYTESSTNTIDEDSNFASIESSSIEEETNVLEEEEVIINPEDFGAEISDEDTEDEYNQIITDNKKLGSSEIGGSQIWKVKTIAYLKQYIGENKGHTILLEDNALNFTEPININGRCIIKGGILKAENLDCFFTINSPANGGPSSVTIEDTTFIVTNGQTIINANGVIQGLNNVINVAGITLTNITIIGLDDTVDTTQSTLLNLNSNGNSNAVSNNILISDNTLNGAKALVLNNNILTSGDTDTISLAATEILQKKATRIISFDATMEVIDKDSGDVGDYYEVLLIDENGNALANKTIQFGFNGNTYSRTTDASGIARLQINIARTGTFTFAITFIDDGYYYGSFAANILKTVKKQSVLTVKNVSYKATATKKLSATFKSPVYEWVEEANGVISQKIKSYKLIKNKKVTFTVNGKTYTATTNSKGVATVKITLNKKGKYTYSAKFAGDGLYEAVTKKATLTINPLSTSLTTKKYTYKKAAKTKKISVTLKSGSKVIKGQKVKIKVNGKTYTAKTNSKGVATVKVSLKKKGTFKYTAKYAGNNIYKATSKTNKLVIK